MYWLTGYYDEALTNKIKYIDPEAKEEDKVYNQINYYSINGYGGGDLSVQFKVNNSIAGETSMYFKGESIGRQTNVTSILVFVCGEETVVLNESAAQNFSFPQG